MTVRYDLGLDFLAVFRRHGHMLVMTLREALEQNLKEPWTGFVVMRGVDKKISKNGQPYFRLTLDDMSVAVAANVFEDRAHFAALESGEWKPGDHMKVMGRVSHHPQFGRQMDLLNIRPVTERDLADGYKPELLMESAPINLEAAWGELSQYIDRLRPQTLRRTVRKLFDDHGAAFRNAAAAKLAHHAYRGGLLQHTLMMLREADALLSVKDFPKINESLVFAGILLHDLGKTEELEPYPRSEYTMSGALLGHVAIVMAWLDESARACGFDGELLIHLKHIVLSHHGQHEFGAAVLPQTAEALFVNLVDNIDSKMQMVTRALSALPEGSHGPTEKLWAFENRAFYKATNQLSSD